MSQKQDKGQQRQGTEEKPGSMKDKPENSEEVANNRTTEGELPPEEQGQLKDRKGSGRWGRPEDRDPEDVRQRAQKIA